MFTGIVEHQGTISRLETSSAGGKLSVHAPTLASQLAVSGSVAVNGCCLTVIHQDQQQFSADLSPETLAKTTFHELKTGARVNLEQPLTAGKEFGGHFVLGHVDATGRVSHLTREGDSWNFGVHVPTDVAPYIVAKGSITIDGISLTVARWSTSQHVATVDIAVIPYTYQHTNLADRQPGDAVNLEADILGKYIERYLSRRQPTTAPAELRVEDLVRNGF